MSIPYAGASPLAAEARLTAKAPQSTTARHGPNESEVLERRYVPSRRRKEQSLADGQASLCSTCSPATIIRGTRLTDEIISCGKRLVRDEIRFSVPSCTGYSARSLRTTRHRRSLSQTGLSSSAISTTGGPPVEISMAWATVA